MWIRNTSISTKRFLATCMFFLFLIGYTHTKSSEYALSISCMFGAYIIYAAYKVYTNGIIVRLTSFTLHNTVLEVRNNFYFRSSKTDTRSITCGENNNFIMSSVPIKKNGRWTYLPFIPKLLHRNHINRALVLGAGGVAVPYLLLRDKLCTSVDAIEKYPKMISIANKYMIPQPMIKGLRIIHNDAKKFVSTTTNQYDFIFVDIFVGTNAILTTDTQLISQVTRLLHPKGILLVNFGYAEYMNLSHLVELYSQNIPKFGIYLFPKSIIGINKKILPSNL